MTRLDLAASRAFGLSRRAARDAVRAGRIDVDGVTAVEPGRDVADAAMLTHHPSRPARRRVRTSLTVLAEDEDFLIVDKPAGLLAVPTAEHEEDTLHARVLDYLHHRYRRRPFAGVAHRIDRDTSGALVFARNRETLRYLQELFRRHTVDREYVALVEGDPPESGTLDAELVRDAGLGRRGVARRGEKGIRAITRFRVLERFPGAALVSVRLETGRTHQIRVHLSSAGYPILGDPVYRRRAAPPPIEVPRQMLHARKLGFPHPRTGQRVLAESRLPADFAAALAQLRRRGVKRKA